MFTKKQHLYIVVHEEIDTMLHIIKFKLNPVRRLGWERQERRQRKQLCDRY